MSQGFFAGDVTGSVEQHAQKVSCKNLPLCTKRLQSRIPGPRDRMPRDIKLWELTSGWTQLGHSLLVSGKCARQHTVPPSRTSPMPYTMNHVIHRYTNSRDQAHEVNVWAGLDSDGSKKKRYRWRFSLVSSTKHYLPDFTQLHPGHWTCSFISHLNSLGSIQPGCHFWCTELFKHTSLHCPTGYPLTPGSRECMCERSALPRSTMSEQIQHSWGSNPRSLDCTSRKLPLSHNAPHSTLKSRVYIFNARRMGKYVTENSPVFY